VLELLPGESPRLYRGHALGNRLSIVATYYDTSFRAPSAEVLAGIRREVYGRDIGQYSWQAARETRRGALSAREGAHAFAAMQKFLSTAHALSDSRHLCRVMYLARKSIGHP